VNALPQDLFEAAKNARERSYSPYSGCKVGAAIRTRDGRIFEGCNVENSSYGAAICAERSAVAHAVALGGRIEIAEVLVVTDATPPWPPCGICRQVLAEFGADAVIHMTNLRGEARTESLRELFPDAFSPAHLKK
jgi:cytidine deaminase